ncbi:MAG: DUF4190 domain-containing protein [Anaerolineales bacterium]|nr:DUF4190 domain-containing protein [Anaerolineales bacterium]
MENPLEPVVPATGELKNNPLALTSLLIGMGGILSGCLASVVTAVFLPLLSIACVGGGFLLGIAALVTGIIGISQIARSEGLQKGKGLAIGGMVTGGLTILLPCVLLLLLPVLGILLGPAIGDVFSEINRNLAP